MHTPGVWGIVVIGAVVILLFGRGKISGLMGEVASGLKAFRKGISEDAAEVTTARPKIAAVRQGPDEHQEP